MYRKRVLTVCSRGFGRGTGAVLAAEHNFLGLCFAYYSHFLLVFAIWVSAIQPESGRYSNVYHYCVSSRLNFS